MDKSRTEQALFEKCQNELKARCVELHWRGIHEDSTAVSLLKEEVRLARAVDDKDMYMQCYADAGNFTESSHDGGFKAIEIEMLHKAAERGDLEASRLLADIAFREENYDVAVRQAIAHIERGGEADDCEVANIEPRHDCQIENETLPWLMKVVEVRPTARSRYVLARCFWDIEQVLLFPNSLRPIGNDCNRDKALPLYRMAADEGYFWSQYYYGLLLLIEGGEGVSSGSVYLQKALMNIPEMPEPNEDKYEKEDTRKWLRETIEKAVYKYTGLISTRVKELEASARRGDLLACIDLAIAYLKGVECPRDCAKAFDYASCLLFENHEFRLLLNRMEDLPQSDRNWLENKLSEEASRLEKMTE